MDDDDVVDEARRAEEEEEEDRARAATRASRASRIVRARELFGALGGLACAMQCISVLPRVRCDELTHPQFQKLIATRSNRSMNTAIALSPIFVEGSSTRVANKTAERRAQEIIPQDVLTAFFRNPTLSSLTPCVKSSPSTSARPVSRPVTRAGSFTASSTASSPSASPPALTGFFQTTERENEP